MKREMFDGRMREICISPEPEGKGEFFRCLNEQGLLNRRPAVIDHKEFLAIQLFYIEKWLWALSGSMLLLITWVCSRNAGNYSFALTPLLAAGILLENRRSGRWKMTELEQAARFSARSVLLARAFLLSTVNTAGLLAVIWAVRSFFSFSPVRVFLYMMVPYLTASLLGSVYERRHRKDQGLGSVVVCILSSVFFASLPFFFNALYEERLTVLWAAAFILMLCGLTACIREGIAEKGEPIWN